MLEPLHLRGPRQPTTLCGASAKSVRTTRSVICATCPKCFARARELILLRDREQIEELQRLGAAPDTWSLSPVELPGAEEPVLKL